MSGLPTQNEVWPPAGHARRYARMRTDAAWYGGDAALLASVHGGDTATGFRQSAIARIGGFWREPNPEAPRRHLPIANEIATRSSELLFADPPSFTCEDEQRTQDGKPSTEAAAMTARLAEILDASNVESLLLQAAETQAALGSVVLRLALDDTGPIRDMPIVAVVQADAAVPEYRWGQLVAVTLWQTISTDKSSTVYRHLERHEGGYVEHGLYKGSPDRLGVRVPIDEHPATAYLAEQLDETARILLDPKGGLTAVSIPNMLPDPLDRVQAVGRSDYTDPVRDLMDAADETYTRMLEHIGDGRSRLIIAESLLTRRGPGRGTEFDATQRYMQRVKFPEPEQGYSGMPIEKVQFDLKVAEHLDALDALQQRAIQAAGYSTRTDAGSDGEAMTATEVSSSDRRSLSTRDKKVRYWRPVLARFAETILNVDAFHYAGRGGSPRSSLPVRVAFPEAVQPSPLDLASLAEALRRSGGASLQTIVETLHPDWDSTTVTTEVERITNAVAVPDPATFRAEDPTMGI